MLWSDRVQREPERCVSFRMQSILQVVFDPRVLLGFGVIFFGGIVGWAELSHHLEQRRRKPHSVERDEGDPDA